MHISVGLLMLKGGVPELGVPWELYSFQRSITAPAVKIILGNSVLTVVGRIRAPPKCSSSNSKNP